MSTSAERMRRMRERRAAGLLPADDGPLRPADELLRPAVEETLVSLGLAPEDVGAAQLARSYADVIDQARDQAWALRWIGPLLLDCLRALQATPASRPAPKPLPAGPSRLAELRTVHARGLDRL